MCVLDDGTLSGYLGKMGWKFRPHGASTFRSTHASDVGEVEVYLRYDDNWLIASVVPFLPTRGQNPFELSRWLLRMNRDMRQLKFAYDDDGDVVLTVELPTENLDYSELETALQALLKHAVEHKKSLREAARAG